MTRETVLAGADKQLIAEIFAQKNLTGCTDEELVLEAVERGLMEPADQPGDYQLTPAGRKAR